MTKDPVLPWGKLVGVRPTKIVMKLLESGASEEEIFAYMTGTYEVTGAKIELSIEIAKREQALLSKLNLKEGYSLYIGIPFCPTTCLYCSFTSYPLRKWGKRAEEYLQALEREIELTADLCAKKKLNTIYIGGGTPTTLSPEQLERLFTKIERSFDFEYLLEYTVEAGRPDSITEEKLAILKTHGIERISVNPQTMQQETLNLIGRNHTVEQTIESFHLARKMGFTHINMDLIIGLPGEGIVEIRDTLEQILKLGPDSLTIHSLALKRGSRLYEMSTEKPAGEETLFSPRNSKEIMDITALYAKKMGLVPYYLYRQKHMAGNFENVGYAKSGKEGLYNILIMEEKQSIMALGAGAITKLVDPKSGHIARIANVKDIEHYLNRIEEMLDRKRKGMKLCH